MAKKTNFKAREIKAASNKKLAASKRKRDAQAKKNWGWYLKECDRNKRKQKKYQSGH